jgi:hypothetical protein
MKNAKIFIDGILALLILVFLSGCNQSENSVNQDNQTDFSGIYCLNIQNLEMTIVRSGTKVAFSLSNNLLLGGTGTVKGDSLQLNAFTADSALFSADLCFCGDRQSFSGPFQIMDKTDLVTIKGVLLGTKGACAIYDIAENDIPKFVETDFTDLSKIEKISKFRSGFGHSYTDGSEICRSMKHYYTPYEMYRKNRLIGIYSPVNGTITSVISEEESGGDSLINNEIQIRPDEQPAFSIVLFHCDIVSAVIEAGKQVQAGELLGYARLFYERQSRVVTSYDIAVWVNTLSGARLISYFEIMEDSVFDRYITRGVQSRQDFIISFESREADLLECNGETFKTEGNLENWVTLH